MMNKYCFEVVDRSFRDILKVHNNGRLDIPFDGKIVVFGGDFRQILLFVPKRTKHDVVHKHQLFTSLAVL